MVTVTFLKFSNRNKWYAITQMGKSHQWLSKLEGVDFYKLMGSGSGNGFSIIPDLSTYCLLISWKSLDELQKFFQENKDWMAYRDRATKFFTLRLSAIKAMGTWEGRQPFAIKEQQSNGKIAVLTRATIKRKFIPYFWSKVPAASKAIKGFKGHIFSKGVGEVPLLHQATISVWESKEAMHSYAYQHDSHVKMIQETRKKGWYSEELFAEFSVVEQTGEIW